MQYLHGTNPTGVRATSAQSTPRNSGGFTILELLIVVAVMLVIAAFAVPAMQAAMYSARCARAVGDLRTIGDALITFQESTGSPANSLVDVGFDGQLDPWGNPYQYLNLNVTPFPDTARTDRFFVPINTDFDLYSKGQDGLSAPSLTDPTSEDDIVWSGDGSYLGLASNF